MKQDPVTDKQESTPPLFGVRALFLVAGARDALSEGEVDKAVRRHVRGDWGSATAQERALNEEALRTGNGPLVSVFFSASGERFWVHTTEERETFVSLVPEEWEKLTDDPEIP